jgi:hypothetical protein
VVIDSATDPPAGTDFFDGPRLDGLAGGTYLLLREGGRATELLSRALAGRERGDAKGRALLTLDLAEAQVIAGDLDHASELAAQALDIARGAVVRPILARAAALRAGMEPWGSTGAAARLDSLLADLVRGADREE